MTPIERLTKFLEVTGDISGKTPALTTLGSSEEWVSYADLRVVANLVTQQSREIQALTNMFNTVDARARDATEWKRKAEALEAERDAIMRQLRDSENSESLHEGRAHAFLEALKLVTGVRE